MGSRSDNGDWPFDGGSSDELPDLPEEWGVIVIPDDLSELAEEVEAIRAELRQVERRTRWQRIAARPAVRRLRRVAAVALKAPVLIISMAVLVTVASLFASAWPGSPRSPAGQRTAGTTGTTGDRIETLPGLELETAQGQPFPLRQKLPAVVLITDGCDCARLIADTTTAVRPTTAVVVVTSGAPPSTGKTPPTGATPQAQGKTVQALRDPTGELRKTLNLGAPNGAAAAVLVDATGQIVSLIPAARSVDELRLDLAKL